MTSTAVPDPRTARARARAGSTSPTAGWAPVTASHPPFAITHAPGRTLVTDVRDSAYRVAS
ncbi:hypothetical protein [Streptomyces sp. NPDC013457]|uniref:hypothetical protein n=1 Tax=Streptomyces sp. NPDC013457 TaxID=3364866 RepID=UPI0037016141